MRSLLTPESEFGSTQAGTVVPQEPSYLTHCESIEISNGAVRSLHVDVGASMQITALDGVGWVTMEGYSEDYVVECGGTSVFTGPGLLVIEGLAEANCFTVASC